MSDAPVQLPTVSVLSWFREVTGDRLLSYLLGCDVESLPAILSGDTSLTARQAELAMFLAIQHAELLKMEEKDRQQAAQSFLMFVTTTGHPYAVILHNHVTGQDAPDLPGDADSEAIFAALAEDSYPGFLLPPTQYHSPMLELVNVAVTAMLFRHPLSEKLQEKMLADPAFSRFPADAAKYQRTVIVHRSTGGEGTCQIETLPEQMLARAWRHVEHQEPTLDEFTRNAVDEFHLVRRLFLGETENVPARLAFAGVLLPPDTSLPIEGAVPGVVRPANDADRKLPPSTLAGKLQTSNEAGEAVTINYDGDVIFEYKVPYRLRAARFEPDSSAPWPTDMVPPPSIAGVVTRLRFALMLAVDRKTRAQLVQTWSYIDEPATAGRSISWSDSRQATRLTPMQLTQDEVAAWGQWYKLLSAEPVKRIELALTRILRASAERREPSDVLIDSVIAWENLFGTRGETIFRVTSSLAVLLAEPPDSRKDFRKNLKDLYELRSSIVHGSRDLKPHEHPRCQEALDIAIKAVRKLVSDRTDILELSDGAGRSEALLVGGQPERTSSGVKIDVK